MLHWRRSVSFPEAGHELNLINWPLVMLSGLFLFLRVFLKIRQRRGLWWDDYILIMSWLALLIQSVLFAHALTLSYSKSPSQITPAAATETFVLTAVSSSLLILSNLWSKTSFGLTLLRLPLGTLRVSLIYVLVTLATITFGISAFLVWMQCLVAKPTPWSVFTGSSCLSPQALIAYSMFVGVFSAVVDFAFVVLPWNLLWGLQMKRSERVGVTVAMGMGVFAGITALVKTSVFPWVYGDDSTAVIQVSAWGALESALSIMAASIPILRALVRQEGVQGVPPGDGEMETSDETALRSDARDVVVRLESGRMPIGTQDDLFASEGLTGRTKSGEGGSNGSNDWDRMGFEMHSVGATARPRNVTV